MRLTHFFIDRPRFAAVLSTFVTLLGLGALAVLPVAQYPEVVPPTVQVTTTYPGASAETVARTVATPLEEEINGVENMLYMSSQSTGDGNLTITVTFRIGTNLNVAQMLTQNRVQDVLPRLPLDVQNLGVQVRKATPSILLAVHLYSTDKSRDTLYLSNYLTLHVKDALARLQGVGDVRFVGGREYAMRIWLDPDKVAAHDLSASEVLGALRAQNLQVSAGILKSAPCARRRGLSDQCRNAWAAFDTRAICRHCRQIRQGGTSNTYTGHWSRRGWRGRLRFHGFRGPRQRIGVGHLRRARHQLARGRPRSAVHDAGSEKGLPSRCRLHDRL